jgi:tetratricopeptide (TPR) repeat protein
MLFACAHAPPQKPAAHALWRQVHSDHFTVYTDGAAEHAQDVAAALEPSYATQLVQHELAHRVIGVNLLAPPIWLNEGLADYLSTYTLAGSRAIFGGTPRKFSFVGASKRRYGTRSDALPHLDELLAATWPTFHAQGREHYFYAASWALVHYLSEGPVELRERLSALMRALAAGTKSERAFGEAFAGVDLAALDRDYRTNGVVTTVHFVPNPFVAPAPAMSVAQPLSEVQARVLALSVKRFDRGNADEVRAELDALVALAPDNAEVHYWRGLFVQLTHDYPNAELHYRAALSRAPSARNLSALIDVLATKSKDRGSEFAELVQQLAQNATTAVRGARHARANFGRPRTFCRSVAARGARSRRCRKKATLRSSCSDACKNIAQRSALNSRASSPARLLRGVERCRGTIESTAGSPTPSRTAT